MLDLRTHNPPARGGYMALHPEDQRAIGMRLKAFRKAVGASQEDLTTLLGGEGNSLWANYEAGDRRIKIDKALILCRTYGVTLEWIYRGQRHTLPEPLREEIRLRELQAERTAKS